MEQTKNTKFSTSVIVVTGIITAIGSVTALLLNAGITAIWNLQKQ